MAADVPGVGVTCGDERNEASAALGLEGCETRFDAGGHGAPRTLLIQARAEGRTRNPIAGAARPVA